MHEIANVLCTTRVSFSGAVAVCCGTWLLVTVAVAVAVAVAVPVAAAAAGADARLWVQRAT